jgi:hypothetical protein
MHPTPYPHPKSNTQYRLTHTQHTMPKTQTQTPNTGRDRPDGSKFRCIIASGKSNIGHLEAASGIMGLIRASLILYHGKVRACSLRCVALRLIYRSLSLSRGPNQLDTLSPHARTPIPTNTTPQTRQQVPKAVHFETPNPLIPWERLPFIIPRSTVDLMEEGADDDPNATVCLCACVYVLVCLCVYARRDMDEKDFCFVRDSFQPPTKF